MKLKTARQIAIGICVLMALPVVSSMAAEKAGKDQMQLTSTAFTEGTAIPAKYTCDAKNVSPALKWSGVPAGAKSLALIADDPDAPAGTWVHWVLLQCRLRRHQLLELG